MCIQQVELPPHLQDMLEAEKEGREWKDPRPTKGRWGPSNLEEVRFPMSRGSVQQDTS